MRNVNMGGLGAVVARCHHSFHKDSHTPKDGESWSHVRLFSVRNSIRGRAPKRVSQHFQSPSCVLVAVFVLSRWHLTHAERYHEHKAMGEDHKGRETPPRRALTSQKILHANNQTSEITSENNSGTG